MKEIFRNPERCLKLLIYICLCIMYGSGLTFGGMFWIFTFVSADFFLIFFVVTGNRTHPECFRRWRDLKKINNKVIWDILKI
jgi:hypothetical protein